MNLAARREEDDEEKVTNLSALCQALQENRPYSTGLFLSFSQHQYPDLDDARATQIGEALRGNTVVKYLQIPVDLMTVCTGTRAIAHFIAVSPSLEYLELLTDRQEQRTTPEQVAVFNLFLAAASLNGKIKHLNFRLNPMELDFSPLVSCLHANRSSLVSLFFFPLTFRHDENLVMTQIMMDGANIIADAVGSLPFLETLSLSYNSYQHLVVPILTRLENHAGLKKLHILRCESASRALCDALASLLQSSTPLEELYLPEDIHARPGDDPNGDAFNALLSVFQGHTTLERLTFCTQADSDEGATQFAAMLRHNESIRWLSFTCYSLVGLSTVIEALGTNSSVKELNVELINLHDEALCSEGGQKLIDLLPRTRHLTTMSLVDLNDDG
jgi:hypothetical protein